MKIENLSLSEIKPYEKNSKKHPKEQIQKIADSISAFGFNQPIVVDKENIIIVGHGRYWAAKKLDLKNVPVLKIDIPEEKAKAYRLADNKLNESEWDMDLVIDELKGLSDELVNLTGFSLDLKIENNEKDDEIPEIPEEPKSKRGEIYKLGKHRVMCGDSTKPEDVEKLMNGKKADMVFTDPPYNVDYRGMQNSRRWKNGIENDALTDSEFQDFLEKVFENYSEVTKLDSAFYICHSDKSHREFRNSFEQTGLEWRATIIWIKNSPGGDHPTIKPVELITRAIYNSSKQEDLILDLFLGSGSTLIAAEKTKRICYGMEIEPKYIDVIIQRWEEYTGGKANKIT